MRDLTGDCPLPNVSSHDIAESKMVKLQIKLNASKAKLSSLMLSSIGLFALASGASAADAANAPVGYVLANDIVDVASVSLNADGSLLVSMAEGSEAILPAGSFTFSNGEVYVDAAIANDLTPYIVSDSGGSLLMVGGAFAAVGAIVALVSSDDGPENVAPVFSSGTTGTFAENTTGTAYSASASDGNGDAISYTMSGADAALFNIDASSGAVTFLSAPDFETPADAGGDNVYNFTVSASDGVLSTSQSVVITVTNENDNAPLITSAATATVSENETDIGYTVTASDADGDTLTYTITGGADAALFEIDSATGALSFAAAQDFEAPADGNTDNQYEVVVQASDGVSTDDQTVTVTVTNVNDNAPVFTSSATASLAENTTATGYAAVTTDADGGAASYSITGGADAALFSVDATTGALSFIAAPDFDAPADANADNVFDVVVTANDGVNTTSQTVAVTLTNVNDNSPIFTSSAVIAFDENGTASPFSVTATDGDGDTLTYSISGGADAARFTIDSATGAVSFVNSPDFEAPTDTGADNTYNIIVRADDGTFQSNQAVAISINNLNDNAPVITGGAASVAENSTATGFTATATDADGNAVTFSISGGADATLFAIDASTGALSFIAAPDFDVPGDAGADNVYDVNVQASDGLATDTAAVAITVTNLNDEIPVFTSAAAVSVDENLTATGYFGTATDGDGDTLSFSISGGVDSALFTIDSATGALSFIAAPDFENPGDIGADNTYDVDVTVSDGVNTATQSVTIAVQDVVLEAPIFSSGATGSVAENSTATAYTAIAVDPNGNPVTYSISGGADAAQFTINASTGDVQLIAAADFEAPGDAGADNVYDIEISAFDGTDTATQNVAISVINENDVTPTFTSSGTVAVDENSTTVFYTTTSTDPDGGTPSYSIIGGPDAALFTMDSATGEISAVAGLDFENPTDANTDSFYELTIQIDDGVNTTSQLFGITVNDVNEAPTFNNPFPTTVAENTTGVFFTAGATDPEGSTVTYSLSGNASFFFTIDSATGALIVGGQFPLDFEAGILQGNIITGAVTASDGSFSTTENVSFQLTDVNEAPTAIPSGFMGSLTFARSGFEGASSVLFQAPGFAQQTSDLDVTWVDPENATLTFTLSGTDAAAFTVDANNNLVIPTPLDFENPTDTDNDNIYEFNLTVSDGVNTQTQAYIYTVRNDADIPVVFTSGATANTPENLQVEPGVLSGFQWQHTPAYTAVAVDGDNLVPVTYSITGGVDAALFSINAATGEVRFVSSPDFEAPSDANTDNVYDVEITASDGTSTAVQSVAITVDDVTGVQFASPNTTVVNENRLFNGVDALVLDAVSDTGAPITYSIVGGADASSGLILQRGNDTFILGVASFRDFENPVDANLDNVYEITVQADDGTTTSTQTIFLTVQDLDDTPPVVTSATAVSVTENSTLAYTLTATDVDTDDSTLTYFIQGAGADNALFTIDQNTGELSFITPPDFENPSDANNDNVYDVTLLASDGTQGVVHTVTITVTDVVNAKVTNDLSALSDISDDDMLLDWTQVEDSPGLITDEDRQWLLDAVMDLKPALFEDRSEPDLSDIESFVPSFPSIIDRVPTVEDFGPTDFGLVPMDMALMEDEAMMPMISFFQTYDVA